MDCLGCGDDVEEGHEELPEFPEDPELPDPEDSEPDEEPLLIVSRNRPKRPPFSSCGSGSVTTGCGVETTGFAGFGSSTTIGFVGWVCGTTVPGFVSFVSVETGRETPCSGLLLITCPSAVPDVCLPSGKAPPLLDASGVCLSD